MKKLKHITEICRELYEAEGQSAVFDLANSIITKGNAMELKYEFCKPCDTESPAWRNTCLCCGSTTTEINLHKSK